MVPLRMTALFARDGDRWIPVFEHLSFGRTPTPARDGSLRGKVMGDARINAALHDELSRVLTPVLSRTLAQNPTMVTGPEAMLLGPDVDDEWHGPAVLHAQWRARQREPGP